MSRFKLDKTIVLVGMMGAGKTAVGTAMARLLDVPFVDSDVEIEKAANMSIAEVFETFGEDVFREKESLVLARLLEGPSCILSTGGGAFMQEANRQEIAKRGLAVWLKADLDLLWERVRQKDTRPLLRVADPRARLAEISAERTPNYAKAGHVVEADDALSVQDMAKKVIASLKSAEHAPLSEET